MTQAPVTPSLDEAAQRLNRAVAALEARARALKAAKAPPPEDGLFAAAPQANGHDPALRQAAEEASAALAEAIAGIEALKAQSAEGAA